MSNLSELLPSGGGQNQVEFVASGTLPNGKAVVLKPDGTVGIISEANDATGITAGSEVVFESAATSYPFIIVDPNNANKFVVAYSTGSQGRACIGTISGTSITFGTAVVFHSSSDTGYVSASFDPNTSGKFVISHTDGSGSPYVGRVIIGTISGSSLSFGTSAVFNNATTYYTSVAFDINTANKFVVAYRDAGNSSYSTARVGTVSGTSISFGSETVFNSQVDHYLHIKYDPHNANKFIVSYVDTGNGSKGTSKIGTVSGTSISFSSGHVFTTASVPDVISLAFDPNTANKFVVAYPKSQNGNRGTARVGTISGNSISYGAEVTFNLNAQTAGASVAFDANNANKFVVIGGAANNHLRGKLGTVSGTSITFGAEAIFNAADSASNGIAFDPNNSLNLVMIYKDGGNSNYGTAQLANVGLAVSNLTSTNLIGIAAEAASSGATAKINTWGGINESQTSLTIGSDYYAQTNGTITTASASPAQRIGTAISATTINMRDLP